MGLENIPPKTSVKSCTRHVQYTVHHCIAVTQAGWLLRLKVVAHWVPQRNGVGFRVVAKKRVSVPVAYTGRNLAAGRGTGTNEVFVTASRMMFRTCATSPGRLVRLGGKALALMRRMGSPRQA